MARKRFSKKRKQLSWAALFCCIVLIAAAGVLLRYFRIGTVAINHTVGLDGEIVAITATVLLSIVAASMIIKGFGDLFAETYKFLFRVFMEPGDDDAGQIAAGNWFNDSIDSQPKTKAASTTYIAKNRDDLPRIARDRYGSQEYAKLLILYSNAGNKGALRTGQEIRTPSLKKILGREGLTKTHEPEVDLLLRAKSSYISIEKYLASLTNTKENDGLNVPARVRKKLDQVANLIDSARIGFASVQGLEKTPTSVIEQLRRLAAEIRKLSASAGHKTNYDFGIFHKRFAMVIVSIVNWARNGYM